MKKYLLKLIQNDIDVINHRIRSWHKNLVNVTDLEFANKQITALNNKLKKAEKYKQRIEKLEL